MTLECMLYNKWGMSKIKKLVKFFVLSMNYEVNLGLTQIIDSGFVDAGKILR